MTCACPSRIGATTSVVHSDTLEHVPHPAHGLTECRRVLKPGGFCTFTVPMVVDRLTLSREGLPQSPRFARQSRGLPGAHRVRRRNAWKYVTLAGFRECRILYARIPHRACLRRSPSTRHSR